MTRTISLPHRRVATMVQLAIYPLTFGITHWAGLSSSLSTLLAIAAFVCVSIYLYRGTRLWQVGNAPDEQLDERQVQVRDRAYRIAYMVVSTLIILSLIYLMLTADFNWAMPVGYNQLNPFFWGAWTIIVVLPSAILAWTEAEI